MTTIVEGIAAIGIASVATVVLSHRDEKKKYRLPKILEKPQQGSTDMCLLAVHVRGVEMFAAHQRDKRFRIQVKYGIKGASLKCDAGRFRPSLPEVSSVVRRTSSSSRVGSTCLFLQSEDVHPIVRITLQSSGLRRSLAKGSVDLSSLQDSEDVSLPLRSTPGGGEFARVSLSFEALDVQRDILIDSLRLAVADQQKDAFLISRSVPMIGGHIIPIEANEDANTDVLVGLRLTED